MQIPGQPDRIIELRALVVHPGTTGVPMKVKPRSAHRRCLAGRRSDARESAKHRRCLALGIEDDNAPGRRHEAEHDLAG